MPEVTTVYTAQKILNSPHRSPSVAKTIALQLIGWQIEECRRMQGELDKRISQLMDQLTKVRGNQMPKSRHARKGKVRRRHEVHRATDERFRELLNGKPLSDQGRTGGTRCRLNATTNTQKP